MSEDLKSREHKFIHEKIVPRKKYKKILGITAAVIGAAVLFGAAAGGTFYLMQEVLPRQDVKDSQVETIIIARDDVSLSPESTAVTQSSAEDTAIAESGSEETPQSGSGAEETTENASESMPESPDASGTPEAQESTDASGPSDSQENTDTAEPDASGEESGNDPETASGTESGADSNDPEASERDSDSEETDHEAESDEKPSEAQPSGSEPFSEAGQPESREEARTPTLQERLRDIRRGIVRLTVRESSATDWLSVAIHEKRELMGIVIAENTDSVLVLTKASGLDSPTAVITAEIDGISCSASFRQGDSLNRITVLRIPKSEVGNHYTVLPLGNSLNLTSADPVWFIGCASEAEIGLNEGMVTYVEQHRPATDGYSQMISTNMLHYPGEEGVLMDSSGAVIGLVADDSCTAAPVMTALGISPLKYLLEDMCSGTNTAYFGIRCMDITSEESEVLGIPSGLYIQEVTPESPAYNAGLLPGDRLVRVDEGSVNTNHMLLLWMDQMEAGKEISVGIERRGPEGYGPLTLSVTPGVRR